jgi:hypothetical protein
MQIEKIVVACSGGTQNFYPGAGWRGCGGPLAGPAWPLCCNTTSTSGVVPAPQPGGSPSQVRQHGPVTIVP